MAKYKRVHTHLSQYNYYCTECRKHFTIVASKCQNLPVMGLRCEYCQRHTTQLDAYFETMELRIEQLQLEVDNLECVIDNHGDDYACDVIEFQLNKKDEDFIN